ncbi:MAG TPA: pyridoxamine 5'-phosphate oxidase family protein [Pseudonocardia sp.]|jgi:nitroimidazol reductase NimA-like FMN-containing flavoprotein (pyridoxamine 5'-phosphate oxidase superfamily)
MGVALTDDEAWALVAGSLTGIVSTLRADGFPVTLPVWFVALNRAVYFRTPATSKKVARLRRDQRASFLVEAGERWSELTAVSFAAVASEVTDERLRAQVLEERARKYGDRGPGARRELPSATVRHYAGESAIIRLTPVGKLITWDNRKIRRAVRE